MEVTIHPAFSVPIGGFQVPTPEGFNQELRRIILDLEATGDAYRNVEAVVAQPEGLYESRFEFFARPEPAVQRLRSICWAVLNEFIRRLNTRFDEAPPALSISSQTWFHVTRNGGYFGYHNHPMASWSGVYCVSMGTPDPDVVNNGCLVFPHPNMATSTYMDIANSTLRFPYAHGNLTFTLVPGQLVLFPSWLGHYVTPFIGSGERITVAFNSWFTPETAHA